MTIKLFGWDGQTNNFEIGELSEIERAGMCVCDGREYLTVIYKNGGATTYSDDTIYRHYDGGYSVYNPVTGANLFANKKWMNAESVADRMIWNIAPNDVKLMLPCASLLVRLRFH